MEKSIELNRSDIHSYFYLALNLFYLGEFE
jgi:hypothetical protein